MGRNAKYMPDFHPEKAREYCKTGAGVVDLARHFGVTRRTIYSWARNYEEFYRALKEGVRIADDTVEHAAYRRAVGFEYTDVKVAKTVDAEGNVTTHTERIKRTVPGDVKMQRYWLANRRKDQWREKVEVEESGEIKLLVMDV
ncbi:MAG TPA: helix-turn-helix domain-containing protein [Chloroflexota bacterium]|nr:helix-turn-helix domain-containing protein [Chloroflexota bacterium]